MTYALVTVFHKPDYPLLRLQARSLARYLPPDFTDKVYVVANDGLTECDEWQQPLLSDYGCLADRICFLDASQVAPIPSSLPGYDSQQVLKLMIARVIGADRYMVLDAKNHLVFPLSSAFYECRDKMRSREVNYYEYPELQYYLNCSLRYFGITGDDIARSFLPVDTPFVFPTRVVCDLIKNVVERERVPFGFAFERLTTTEFLLFGAFLYSRPGGIEQFYDMSGQACPVIRPRTVELGHVEYVASRVESERLPFFSVHRRAFRILDDRSKAAIATVWAQRHLFDSFEQALRFVARMSDDIDGKDAGA